MLLVKYIALSFKNFFTRFIGIWKFC